MQNITLEQKIRATGVSRWHIVRTLVPQSVAEHLYSVAMIADTAWMLFCNYYLTYSAMAYQNDRSRIIDRALHHDVLEALTGDHPSPYKRWAAGRGHVLPDPYHLLKHDKEATRGGHTMLDPIIVLCDRIEAWHFINRYAADDHGRMVADRLEWIISKANEWMPQYIVTGRVPEVESPYICVDSNKPRSYAVDWPRFAKVVIGTLQSQPEEISDDDSVE